MRKTTNCLHTMSASTEHTTVEEIKTANISVEKVRDLIEGTLNKDLDVKTDALNANALVKTYRKYQFQLAKGKITELDADGEKLTKTVPVLDKEGNQVFISRVDKTDPKKKKRVSVPATKEVTVSHDITDAEVTERKEFMATNKAQYKTITRECSAFNEHRTSVSKRGVGYFNEFLKSTAVNLLIKAGEYVDDANLKAMSESGARVAEKPKIGMSDLASCDYMDVAGIKVFITPAFGKAIAEALVSRDESLSEAIAKKIKKNLKAEGFVKNDSLKRQEAAKKKKEKADKERKELAKYAGKTYEEVLALKEQEKKDKALARKSSKKTEEVVKKAPKYVFANAIKRAFKDATKTLEGKSRYSVSSKVLAFFEESCHAACIEVANAAHFYCKREDTTVYNTDEMIHHIGILHGGSINVSVEFSSYIKAVPKAEVLEQLRADNKVKRQNGEVVANIDKSKLPTEDVIAVRADFKYTGDGAEYFNELIAKDDEYKRERKLAIDSAKRKKEEKKTISRVEPSVAEVSSDEEEEVPVPVKKVTKKKKVQVVQEDDSDDEQVLVKK